MTQLDKIIELLDSLISDFSIPRNVRNAISQAKEKLQNSSEIATGIGGAICLLEEVSGDVNLPMHGRTIIWNVLSELEAIKTSKKKS